jgi:hypothetical protein
MSCSGARMQQLAGAGVNLFPLHLGASRILQRDPVGQTASGWGAISGLRVRSMRPTGCKERKDIALRGCCGSQEEGVLAQEGFIPFIIGEKL